MRTGSRRGPVRIPGHGPGHGGFPARAIRNTTTYFSNITKPTKLLSLCV